MCILHSFGIIALFDWSYPQAKYLFWKEFP